MLTILIEPVRMRWAAKKTVTMTAASARPFGMKAKNPHAGYAATKPSAMDASVAGESSIRPSTMHVPLSLCRCIQEHTKVEMSGR